MSIAGQVTFTAFRFRPWQEIIRVGGVDLTAIGVFLAADLYPDAPGEPTIALQPTAVQFGEGVRLVRVEQDDDGLPVSVLEAIASKDTMSALPFPGERGDDLRLVMDLKIARLPLGGGFASVETTLFSGFLIIKGSVNG